MFQDDYGFHQEYMTQKSVRDVIAEIVEDWFLLEPVLFARVGAFCLATSLPSVMLGSKRWS